MTTARTVPVTTEMDGEELDAEDAWHLVRHHGVRRVLVEAFVRFRYGDGFTNSRALALQTCLAVVPFMLAVTGLAADIDEEQAGPGAGRDRRGGLAGHRAGRRPHRRARRRLRGGGRGGADDRAAVRAALDDDGDGPGRARRQPDLRHPARPAGTAQVRPGCGVHRAAGRPGRPRLPAARRGQRVRRRHGPRVRLVRGDAALVAGAALAGRAGDAGARDRGALRPRARGGGSRRCRGWPSARRSRCC